MKQKIDWRSLLRTAGMSLGIGIVYEFAPLWGPRLEAEAIGDFLKDANGEAPATIIVPQ